MIGVDQLSASPPHSTSRRSKRCDIVHVHASPLAWTSYTYRAWTRRPTTFLDPFCDSLAAATTFQGHFSPSARPRRWVVRFARTIGAPVQWRRTRRIGADGSVLRTHTGPQRRGEALVCVATMDYAHATPERNAANERCTKWPSAPGRNAATERRIQKLPWSAGYCSGSATARVWQRRERGWPARGGAQRLPRDYRHRDQVVEEPRRPHGRRHVNGQARRSDVHAARQQPQLFDNSLLITLLMLSTQLHCSINQVTLVAGYVIAKIVSR
eukprot:CAMPEP_0179920362 /NCGR_PEP_ID=MMETSP0983-20121128/4438_1 /TAXON_ID=483367 /ORGANISM="non described non described, Strain CCMP 2436" /LENGTH=268 /DNA_ID=CAMNT_0021823383 /DNA_START=51 /DNA_END=857 /DNA_ORIENTATION=-